MQHAIKFAYDGTKFSGLQRQPNVKTVEGEIIACLKKHQIKTEAHDSKIRFASRTDAGVSALGNVCTFSSTYSCEYILKNLNSKVDNCYFFGTAHVEDDFNPRYAKSRWYRYHLFNGNGDGKIEKDDSLDLELLTSILPLFEGEHNFRNFAKPHLKHTTRVMESISLKQNGDWILIDLRASGFLWHQVRRLVSSWVKFARGELERDTLKLALTEPEQRYDFSLASPEPLFLMDVEYNFEFTINHEILSRTKTRLSKKLQNYQLKNQFLEYLMMKL